MKNKKKVLFIITRLTIGGVAAHLIQTAKYLEDNGYQCLIMTGSIEENDLEMIRFHNDYTIKPLYLKELQRVINPFKDLIAILKLNKEIKKIKPDIVHTHTMKAGLVGRISAWICHVPQIYHTYHGLNFEGYFGKILSFVSIYIEKIMAKLSTKLISLSPLLTKELLKHKICKADKIVDIPLGFDFVLPQSPKSLRQLFSISQDKIIVASIGRLARIKNHELFIKIAKLVCAKSPDIQFLIVGDGERRQELQNMINAQNLQNDIIITGFFNDLNNYYPEIDINLLTSLNEGTPVTIMESFFFDILVLSSTVGGVPDMIKDGHNGFLFDLDNAQAYVDRIIDFAQNRERYSHILSNARQDFNSKYTLQSSSKKLLDLYTCARNYP
ncbi:MAG: glycosyltransferase family 4 protein [Candidatus Cloacimonetes bacterium]|nr:glycosyltransferase family 4 protein [Candidatus Cloacimonadota bacterium]